MANPRKMRSAVKVGSMGRKYIHAGFWWGNLKDTAHFEYLGVDSKVALK
jgi:hypothetical protein